jgi:hypothetical protein
MNSAVTSPPITSRDAFDTMMYLQVRSPLPLLIIFVLTVNKTHTYRHKKKVKQGSTRDSHHAF